GILNNQEIPPGGEGTFELCFTPKRLGESHGGNVFVYTDNEVHKVAVTGRGGAPRIVATPDELDLGPTSSCSPTVARVKLTNVGDPLALDVTSVRTPRDGALAV